MTSTYDSWQQAQIGGAPRSMTVPQASLSSAPASRWTKTCPACGQPSTVLLSLGICGHCSHKPGPDEDVAKRLRETEGSKS